MPATASLRSPRLVRASTFCGGREETGILTVDRHVKMDAVAGSIDELRLSKAGAFPPAEKLIG
jgi:hypothetical protein